MLGGADMMAVVRFLVPLLVLVGPSSPYPAYENDPQALNELQKAKFAEEYGLEPDELGEIPEEYLRSRDLREQWANRRAMQRGYAEENPEVDPRFAQEYMREYGVPDGGHLQEDPKWPAQDLHVGQVGGLAVDSEGQVYVFHRANRTWADDTFDEENVYQHQSDGPIKSATLYKLNSTDGKVLKTWGANRFYMPHGLHIDHEGNLWMTDVATHQVYKFEAGKEEPSLTLGKAFEPAQDNSDQERFCKPADVAVASNGDIFVADGYCNSRIVKFDKNGKFLKKFGDDEFVIPHSLALAEEMDTLCVADRENYRIVCFGAGIEEADWFGQPVREYVDPSLGRVFAIAYNPKVGNLYAVSGPTADRLPPNGFTFNLNMDGGYGSEILDMWSPKAGFSQPHALAVSPDDASVYVGEIGPNNVWKFENTRMEAEDDENLAEELAAQEQGEEGDENNN